MRGKKAGRFFDGILILSGFLGIFRMILFGFLLKLVNYFFKEISSKISSKIK
jgi:vacuolar-type H+-ATPase subunit I/STV1